MDLRKDLKAAQGQDTGPVKLCLVTIIGAKLNDVVQDIDCPPFVVWATDARAGIPTEEQRAACLRLWATNPGAPSSYEFPENGWPRLPERHDPKSDHNNTVSTTDINPEEND